MISHLKYTVALIAGAQAWKYRSGSIGTNEAFKYGKFAARMRGPGENGTNFSLFTYWKGSKWEHWSKSGWSEIDIEVVPSITKNTHGKHGPYHINLIRGGD